MGQLEKAVQKFCEHKALGRNLIQETREKAVSLNERKSVAHRPKAWLWPLNPVSRRAGLQPPPVLDQEKIFLLLNEAPRRAHLFPPTFCRLLITKARGFLQKAQED